MPSPERIAAGYALAEGPVATADGGVSFSDALGGGVFHWSPATGAVTTLLEKRRGIGGMAPHAGGGLVVSGRDLSVLEQDGTTRVLFADHGGTGINDITVDPHGRVVIGVLAFHPFKGEEPVPGRFLRADDGAEVLDGVFWPNGCAYFGDTFYACDYHRGVVWEVRDSGRRIAFTSASGDADGMAVDDSGALWVALGSRPAVARVDPSRGTVLETVDVDAEFVASVCFGGSDGRDLFITTGGERGGVFHWRAPVAGAPVYATAG